MSVGLSFVRRLLDERGPLTFLATFGLTEQDFVDDELDFLLFVEDHISRYGRTPSVQAVETAIGRELPTIPDEPIEFWSDQLKNRSLTARVRTTINQVSGLLQSGEYDEVSNILRTLGSEMLQRNSANGGGLATLQELSVAVLGVHDQKQRSASSLALAPFGFNYLDSISDGLQVGDTVALVGETGVGKTYTLLRMAKAVHDAGGTPLVISMEMASAPIARRILALRTKIPENRIRRGHLSTLTGRRRIEANILDMGEEPPYYIIDGSLVLQVEDLALYVQSLRPTAMFIDGAYLLESRANYKNIWDVVAVVAKRIKQLTTRMNIATIGTYQLNSDKEIYGSKQIKQLASIVLHLLRDGTKETENRNARIIEIVKGRSGERGKFRISYDMISTAIEEMNVIEGFRYLMAEEDNNNNEED